MTGRQRLSLWGPPSLLIALQTFLSSRPPALLPHLFPHSDKVVHVGYFFLIALLAYRAGRHAEGWTRGRAGLVALLATAGFGLADEFHQSFTPSREADVWDLVADLTGAACAAVFGERILGFLRFSPPVGVRGIEKPRT
ncbi:MAG: VanZ family protein [Acidobacteria bacterium]|nr:VanZ family protein [Acidobacteriota bacterium]